ncbi:MAG: glycine betaine/L-proline ABC transporter ATP-binding protein [Caldilineae bacterium]|nr:MAG: glycine betaine/L-proline ABC transporter ATP-binding protein [Caldilineae bacterium]
MSDFQITCRNIWKIFGPHPDRVKATLDPRLSQAEIREQTGHVVAVKDVSFRVRKGETFVVMGLSGSGKSTLVRCISRLIEPTGGQVLIDGEDVTAMDEKQLRDLRRRKLSMVFQHFGLFPHRRILDNAAYGLEIQGVERDARYARARQVLELVGLQGWENHYPGELSGGMQQRVGIARALAVDPEILLFDEPFSALDPLIRREMQDELLNLQKMMHKTIIFITHDFLEAVKLGDYIAIMKGGEIVQTGSPQEIIMHPANEYVREFTKDVPRSRVLTAGSIMHPAELAVLETASPADVLAMMERSGNELAFVQAEEGRFLGAVRRETLSGAARPPADGLRPLVEESLPTVSPAASLAELTRLIVASDTPLPVVDDSRRLVGVVDRTSVLLALGGAE